MSLDFLQRVGVAPEAHVELTPEQVEFEQVEQQQDALSLAALKSETEQSHQAIENVLAALDVATGLKAHGVDTKLVAAVFGEHLAAAGVPEDVAEEKSVGLESAGEEIGNEALQTAKDIVMDIINWLMGRWEDLKGLIKRTFARNFGSIKRNLAAFRKVKTRIDAFQDEGRTVEDKSKLEIKRGASYLVLGKAGDENPKAAEAWGSIAGHIEVLDGVVNKSSDKIGDKEIAYADSLSELNTTVGDLTDIECCEGMVDFNTGSNAGISKGIALLGRQVLLAQARHAASVMSAANGDKLSSLDEPKLREAKKFVNGLSCGVKPSNIKLKSLEEVKVSVPTLDELSDIVDAHIELHTNALALETNKKITKLTKEFDKALASAKKWTKDTENDSPEAKRKAITAAGLMSAIITKEQDASLGVVGDLIATTSAMGKAHGAVIGTALGRYKKA